MSHQTKHAPSRTNGNCEQLKWETRAEAKQEKLAFEASTTKAVYVCVQLNTILCIENVNQNEFLQFTKLKYLNTVTWEWFPKHRLQ